MVVAATKRWRIIMKTANKTTTNTINILHYLHSITAVSQQPPHAHSQNVALKLFVIFHNIMLLFIYYPTIVNALCYVCFK